MDVATEKQEVEEAKVLCPSYLTYKNCPNEEREDLMFLCSLEHTDAHHILQCRGCKSDVSGIGRYSTKVFFSLRGD